MKTENPKFDSVVLFVVAVIGFVFIGIAVLSIIKNDPANQITDSSFASLQAITIPVNGICGTANGKVFESSPSADLCSTGKASVVVLEDGSLGKSFVWQCVGEKGGVTSSCVATVASGSVSEKVDGECGQKNKTEVTEMPNEYQEYCNGGDYVKGICEVPIYDSAKQKWQSVCNWTCAGIAGGQNEKCQLTLVK